MTFDDLAGSAIYAVAAGIVRAVRPSQPYGLHVCVDYGNGYQTFYTHLTRSMVAAGDPVHAGQQVGWRAAQTTSQLCTHTWR